MNKIITALAVGIAAVSLSACAAPADVAAPAPTVTVTAEPVTPAYEAEPIEVTSDDEQYVALANEYVPGAILPGQEDDAVSLAVMLCESIDNMGVDAALTLFIATGIDAGVDDDVIAAITVAGIQVYCPQYEDEARGWAASGSGQDA